MKEEIPITPGKNTRKLASRRTRSRRQQASMGICKPYCSLSRSKRGFS